MKLKTYRKGLSLIEILISILLIMSIIMTFAMVFPSGMRLNATNLRANKATEIANGVMEEIKNMPLCNQGISCPTEFLTPGNMKSLECLNTNWGRGGGTAYWRPSTLPQGDFYRLSTGDLNMVFQSSQLTTSGLALPCNPLSNYEVLVTVTIRWADTKTGTEKTLTTSSLFNTNR